MTQESFKRVGLEIGIYVEYEQKRPDGYKAYIRCSGCNINTALDKEIKIQDIVESYILSPHAVYCDKCKRHMEILKQSEKEDHS